MKRTKTMEYIFGFILTIVSLLANLVTIFSVNIDSSLIKFIINISSLLLTFIFIILLLKYKQANNSLKALASYIKISKMNQNIDISRLEKDLHSLPKLPESETERNLTEFREDIEKYIIEQNYQLGVRAKEALNHIFEAANGVYGGILGYECSPTLYLFVNDFKWNIELGTTKYYKSFVSRDKIGEKTNETFILTPDMYNIIKSGEIKNTPIIIEDRIIMPISTKTMSSKYFLYGFLEVKLNFINKLNFVQKEIDIEELLKPLSIAISEELSYYIYSLHTQMLIYYSEANSSLKFGYESTKENVLFELDFLKELYNCLKV